VLEFILIENSDGIQRVLEFILIENSDRIQRCAWVDSELGKTSKDIVPRAQILDHSKIMRIPKLSTTFFQICDGKRIHLLQD
jgi:hypothetical protein